MRSQKTMKATRTLTILSILDDEYKDISVFCVIYARSSVRSRRCEVSAIAAYGLTVGCKLTNNGCRERPNSLYEGGLAVPDKSTYSSVAGSPSADHQVAKLGFR